MSLRPRSGVRLLFSALALSAACAQAATDTLGDRYEEARRELEQRRADEATSRANRDRLAGEAEDLRTRLVTNAARVQDLETAAAATAEEIARLRAEEEILETDLADDRQRVAALLAVLQRLDAVQ